MADTRTWLTQPQIDRAKRLHDGGYTLQEIADRIGSSKGTIGKLKLRGWKRHARADRPRPMDLSLQAAHMTIKELMAHYRVGHQLLDRWLAEAKAERPDMRWHAPVREMPADFAEVAARLTHTQLLRHYNATGYVITRWRVAAGLATPKHDAHVRRTRVAAKSVGWAERYVAEARA